MTIKSSQIIHYLKSTYTKKYLIIYLTIGSILTIVSLSIFFKPFSIKQNHISQAPPDQYTYKTPTPTPTINPTPQVLNSEPVNFYFSVDQPISTNKAIWYYTHGKIQKITDLTAGSVYTYNPQNSWFAYSNHPEGSIQKLKNPTSNVFIQEGPNSAPQKIFATNLKDYPDAHDYHWDHISDLTFTPDNNILIISTNNSIIFYDIKTKQLQTVYSTSANKEITISTPSSYNFPQLSPSHNKLLITKGYWEGVSYMIIDLNTGKTTDLPYKSGHGPGDIVIGWKDDDHLILDSWSLDSNDISTNQIYLTTLPSLERIPILTTPPNSMTSHLPDNRLVYCSPTSNKNNSKDRDCFIYNLSNNQDKKIAFKNYFDYFDPTPITDTNGIKRILLMKNKSREIPYQHSSDWPSYRTIYITNRDMESATTSSQLVSYQYR